MEEESVEIDFAAIVKSLQELQKEHRFSDLTLVCVLGKVCGDIAGSHVKCCEATLFKINMEVNFDAGYMTQALAQLTEGSNVSHH